MFASLCILGRQPELGLAELESLYGSNAVQPIGESAALLDKDTAEVAFAFLGGTVKFCKVLTELDSVNWQDVQKFLLSAVPQHAKMLPDGKLRLGLSVYGLSVRPNQITGTGLEIKKILRKDGRSVRVVPNKEAALNSAQVLHNQLTSGLGWELVFVRHGSKTIVAQTIAEQDIEAYAKRDHGRPKRDAKVGMLPPKLAQIIINLATAKSLAPGCGPAKPLDEVILDPFCGTGVILQEAVLMGYKALGTDLEPRMIDFSRANLKWLGFFDKNWQVEAGDATDYKWPHFDIVATETYLGQPFSATPSPDKLKQVIQDVNTITTKFLKNLAEQTKPGFKACIAVPAWQVSNSRLTAHDSRLFKHLPVLDQLTDMGYTRVSFVHADGKDLIYHREGQIVGRELVVLTRI